VICEAQDTFLEKVSGVIWENPAGYADGSGRGSVVGVCYQCRFVNWEVHVSRNQHPAGGCTLLRQSEGARVYLEAAAGYAGVSTNRAARGATRRQSVALEAEPRAAPRPVHMQKCKFAKMGKCRFDKNCRFSHLGTKQFPQVRPFDEVVDPVRADAAAARNRLPKAVPESEASSDEDARE
jgi:hypothetical protein